MEGKNGEGDWGSFSCPKTSSRHQTPTKRRNPLPISRYLLGTLMFPWVSVDTEAMCEGRLAMRETPDWSQKGVKDVCPGQPHHPPPRELCGQRGAPGGL